MDYGLQITVSNEHLGCAYCVQSVGKAFVRTGMNRPLGLFYQSGPEFSEEVWTEKIMRETSRTLEWVLLALRFQTAA